MPCNVIVCQQYLFLDTNWSKTTSLNYFLKSKVQEIFWSTIYYSRCFFMVENCVDLCKTLLLDIISVYVVNSIHWAARVLKVHNSNIFTKVSVTYKIMLYFSCCAAELYLLLYTIDQSAKCRATEYFLQFSSQTKGIIWIILLTIDVFSQESCVTVIYHVWASDRERERTSFLPQLLICPIW